MSFEGVFDTSDSDNSGNLDDHRTVDSQALVDSQVYVEILLEVMDSLTEDDVKLYDECFESLPEDDDFIKQVDKLAFDKMDELGVSKEFLQKLVLFKYGMVNGWLISEGNE